MTFKEKLVILRKMKGLTQDEFASFVGVSRQAVYKWESGQSYPEVPKLLEMKVLFNISIDELLDDNYDIPLPEKKKKKRAAKENAAKVEKEVKAPKVAPKAAPAPKAVPVAPKATPVVTPVAPVTPVAQPAPKAEPVAAPVAPVAPAASAAPATPVAPKVAPAAPAAQPAPKVEPKIDTVPDPIVLEDIVTEEETKNDNAKKGNFFGRLFGRR